MSQEKILQLEKEIEELKIKVKEIESWQRRSQSDLMPKQYDTKFWE
jgi:hypothetical protein